MPYKDKRKIIKKESNEADFRHENEVLFYPGPKKTESDSSVLSDCPTNQQQISDRNQSNKNVEIKKAHRRNNTELEEQHNSPEAFHTSKIPNSALNDQNFYESISSDILNHRNAGWFPNQQVYPMLREHNMFSNCPAKPITYNCDEDDVSMLKDAELLAHFMRKVRVSSKNVFQSFTRKSIHPSNSPCDHFFNNRHDHFVVSDNMRLNPYHPSFVDNYYLNPSYFVRNKISHTGINKPTRSGCENECACVKAVRFENSQFLGKNITCVNKDIAYIKDENSKSEKEIVKASKISRNARK